MKFEPCNRSEFQRATACVPAHGTFFKPEVIDAYGEAMRFFVAKDSGNYRGVFAAYETSILARKALITPPFWPSIGPLLAEASGKSVSVNHTVRKGMRAFTEFLLSSGYHRFELSLPPEVVDVRPVLDSDMDVSIRYTYRLDLSMTNAQIFNGYEDKLRSEIKTTAGRHFKIAHQPISISGADLISKSLQKKNAIYHKSIFDRIAEAADKSLCWMTEVTGEGDAGAGAICYGSGSVVYYLFGGTNEGGKAQGCGPVCLHHAIIEAKSRGFQTFDFEGSMMPNVERYFMQFGGKLTPYFILSRNMKLYKRLRKMMGKT